MQERSDQLRSFFFLFPWKAQAHVILTPTIKKKQAEKIMRERSDQLRELADWKKVLPPAVYVSAIYVSSYNYMCPHTTIDVSSYYYKCVLILLYMCPDTTTYVSSYYYICVLILL